MDKVKDSLLICIAFHYNPDRIKYLAEILDVFLCEYHISVDIIIDTNAPESKFKYFKNSENVKIVSHENLEHPFHLTWVHRKHIKENIDKYENFMYVEDDMYLPFKNYVNYLENFKILWPRFIPSFIRCETANSKLYCTDAKESQLCSTTSIEGKEYSALNNPYHAFWIMPQKELKETMIKDFDRLHQSRETAASYPMWELNKTPLVEVYKKDKYYVHPKCFSYHLPNNYAISKESEFAKVEVKNLFV